MQLVHKVVVNCISQQTNGMSLLLHPEYEIMVGSSSLWIQGKKHILFLVLGKPEHTLHFGVESNPSSATGMI